MKSISMHRYLLLIIAIIYFLVLGCKDQSRKNLLPELATCDSAAVMYYNTPGNPRFFNMTKVYDKKILSMIAEDVNGKVIKSKDTCSTLGKIYYYGKGDAVYSVYFSRLKDCMTISFIKTGEKYFVSMSEATKKLLDELQKAAKEPRSEINN
ncbi:MAG: hypothetical protein ACXWV1_09720 [Chitinophagaceae bacterium]